MSTQLTSTQNNTVWGGWVVVATLFAALLASVLLHAGPAFAHSDDEPGQVIDRIVAVVNGEVITLGQLERALSVYESNRLSGLVGACGIAAAGADQATRQVEALDCLIDSLLVFQYVRRFPQVDVTPGQISTEFQEIATTFATRADFEDEMQRWGFTTATLRRALERQLIVDSYIDTRFREFVDIPMERVTAYYEGTLAEELRRRGEPLPPLETVSDLIGAILREEEVNRRVEEWIIELRERAEILTYLW
jgi:hypothetical protein